MIKKALCLAVLVVLSQAPTWAGGSFALAGSFWDTDAADSDVGLGLLAGFDVSSVLTLELRAASLIDLEVSKGLERIRLEAAPLEIGLAYDFRRGETVSPYLGAGLGYYVLNAESPKNRRIEDEAGFYGVLGVDVLFGRRWGLVAEVLYRAVKAEIEGEAIGDFVKQDVDLSGFGANLGILYHW